MIGVGKRERKQQHISGFFGLLSPQLFSSTHQLLPRAFACLRGRKMYPAITLSPARCHRPGHSRGSVLAGKSLEEKVMICYD